MATLTELTQAQLIRKTTLYVHQLNALCRMGCRCRPIAAALDAHIDDHVDEIIRRAANG